MSSFRRSGSALCVSLLCVGIAVSGCGECVFEIEVTATVVDRNGDPLADVEVTTCLGERCAVGEGDDGCVRAVTDGEGSFTLEVPQCRPEPFQCELRPLLLEMEGCPVEVHRLEQLSSEERLARVLTYACDV